MTTKQLTRFAVFNDEEEDESDSERYQSRDPTAEEHSRHRQEATDHTQPFVVILFSKVSFHLHEAWLGEINQYTLNVGRHPIGWIKSTWNVEKLIKA